MTEKAGAAMRNGERNKFAALHLTQHVGRTYGDKGYAARLAASAEAATKDPAITQQGRRSVVAPVFWKTEFIHLLDVTVVGNGEQKKPLKERYFASADFAWKFIRQQAANARPGPESNARLVAVHKIDDAEVQ